MKCDCESLKEFVALVDFEHLVPREHIHERGSILFRKEFYDTGLCIDAEGAERSLKAFAREWILVTEPGEDDDKEGHLVCSDPDIGEEDDDDQM